MGNRLFAVVWVLAVASLGGCGSPDLDRARSETQTLYRNSPVEPGQRIHWATFDAADGLGYNENNCRMAARVLNANVEAASGGPQPVGFWCEVGAYREEGPPPPAFTAEFPVK